MKCFPPWIISIAFLIFFCHPSFCQYQISGKSLLDLREAPAKMTVKPFLFNTQLPFLAAKDIPADFKDAFQYTTSHIPSIYSYDELGMFCKFEVQLEKATRFPVKIRLGEVEAVDRKEGKWQFDH